jgi:hypothetical protein
MAIIFSFVMAAGRVGKLGERVGSAMGKRGPQPGDPVIRAREVPTPPDAGGDAT